MAEGLLYARTREMLGQNKTPPGEPSGATMQLWKSLSQDYVAPIAQMAAGKAKRVDLSIVDRLLDFLSEKANDQLTLDDLLKKYPA